MEDRHRHGRDNPSFSSSLLDAIYQSIDQPQPHSLSLPKHDFIFYTKHIQKNQQHERVKKVNRTSTSVRDTDSSSGAAFSSSESDSTSRSSTKSTSSIRNTFKIHDQTLSQQRQSKTLKKPISPGGRLASFLHSIFKKPKTDIKNAPTCSSASTSSRSCLTKTPKLTKRSVRFVDEDREEEAKLGRSLEEKRRVQDLLKNYSQIRNRTLNFNDDDDDNDDDDASCGSSDLFELDNLSAIGMERYGEELPVYETTSIGTNRAIANGYIM